MRALRLAGRLTPFASLAFLAFMALPAPQALAQALPALKETPMLQVDVASGKLPAVDRRVPAEPLVLDLKGDGLRPGKPGGDLRTLIGRARDVRLMTVFGYSRLVGYDRKLELQPDILKSITVEDERIYTMKLRRGHRWSDGTPFTSEDFRYFWEDIANNPELSPAGPPVDLLAEGERPKVEIIDATTVRYSWTKRNPYFLPRLAGPSPLYIYRPAHYMKKFHKKYADPVELQNSIQAANVRGWPELHNKLDNLYEMDNPALPTLEPWMIMTRPPAVRFIAVRNPFFHRIDQNGQQLPYIDRIVMNQADAKLIAAKSGAGEADLQVRNISFSNFTFLKENEKRAGYRTLLWRTAKGSHFALFPNLNANDAVWRKLMRDVRFRRALSVAIDREGINQSLFFGLATESNNTMLSESPLFREDYQKKWTDFDLKMANALLDDIGLKQRGKDGIRLLPDGRPLEIIVETAGEDTEQTDILELIGESWAKAGVKLFSKPSQREVVRNRIFSGEAVMSVWTGFENGVATAQMNPAELAPTSQYGLQWPKWGQYHETKGQSGEKIDIAEAQQLYDLSLEWLRSGNGAQREKIWHQMLAINTDQQFSIGVIAGVLQPIIVQKTMRNIPDEGIYNWDPGSFLGMYRPDTFWYDR